MWPFAGQPVRRLQLWFVLLQEYTRERGLQVPIEVEARTLQEVHEVLAVLDADPGCIDRIMLDNMTRLDPTLPGAPNTAPFACFHTKEDFRCSVHYSEYDMSSISMQMHCFS